VDLGALPDAHLGDVALGHLRVQHHPRQVGDSHHHRAGVGDAARDDLPDFDIEDGDHAVHGSGDRGVRQAVLGPFNLRFGGGQGALGHGDRVGGRLDGSVQVVHPLQGVVQIALGDIARLIEGLHPLQLAPGEGDVALQAFQPGLVRLEAEPLAVAAGLGGDERGLQVLVIELADDVPLADLLAFAEGQLHDLGRNFGLDLHVGVRLDLARRLDGLDQGSHRGRLGPDLGAPRFGGQDGERLAKLRARHQRAGDQGRHDEQQYDQKHLHDRFPRTYAPRVLFG
jgi:hypothetical protein